MYKTPSLTPKKVIATLKRFGFRLDHTTGSHFVFYRPQDKKRIVVPYHTRDMAKGTLHSILKQAGISKEDL